MSDLTPQEKAEFDAVLDAPASSTEKAEFDAILGGGKPAQVSQKVPDTIAMLPHKKQASSVPQGLVNFMGGATGTMRGAANLVGQAFSGSKWGDQIWPTTNVDKESGLYTAGAVADPAALAIGGAAGKFVGYGLSKLPATAEMARKAQLASTLGVNRAGARATLDMTPQAIDALRKASMRMAVLEGGVGGGLGGAAVGGLQEDGTAATGALFGAGIGAAAAPLAGAATRGYGKLADLVQGRAGVARAGEIARTASGQNIGQIRQAMLSGTDDLTATQAASGINQDPFMALGAFAKSRDPSSYYRLLEEAQQSGRQNMLSGITPDLAKAIAARKAQNTTDIAAARETQRLAQGVRDASAMPSQPLVTESKSMLQPGMVDQRVLPTRAPTVQPALDALEGLKGNAIIQSAIRDARSTALNRKSLPPGLAKLSDAQLRDILRDPMRSMEGLEVMKASIDNALKGITPEASALKGLNTADLTVAKKALVSAMESTNPEYRAARLNYMGNSAPVNQSQVLQELQSVLKSPTEVGEKASAFLNAQGRGEGTALRRAGLDDRFFGGVGDVLTPEQNAVRERINQELLRDAAIKNQAARGAGGLRDVMADLTRTFKLPSWMNQKAALANKTFDEIAKDLSKDTVDAIVAGMRNGKSAGKLLSELPASERSVFLANIRRASESSGAALGADVGNNLK